MPRYFFHIYHDRLERDHEGEELPDKHAAWREATVMAGQALQCLDGKLQPGREWRMEVTDESENPLTSFTSMPRNPARPPVRGGGGIPHRIMVSSRPSAVLRMTGAG